MPTRNERAGTARFIEIEGAHAHNLKNVSLSVPKHAFVAFTGVSGSGKSTLLFDTIYTEAQRQLVETFSTFARNRLPKLSRPDVESIRNLSTAILIDQKKMGSNLRSTVGTATEVVTYLRLLYSRLADPFVGPSFYYSFNHPEGMCPVCHGLGTRIAIDTAKLVNPALSLREGAIDHPECRVNGFLWREMLSIDLFDPDKKVADFTERELHLLLRTEPVPVAKRHGAGTYLKNWEGIARRLERLKTAKADAEESDDDKDAYDRYFSYGKCEACSGTRLSERARSTKIAGFDIGELCAMEIRDLIPVLEGIDVPAAVPILRKAIALLRAMDDVGIGYLSLDRPTSTLSGGESQRVKTARQLDCDLTDLMYVLDEPSAGLHPRDTERLTALLARLRDAGNSVYVVEHDPEIVRKADWVVDLGPKAGSLGGEVVYNGPLEGFGESGTLTARFLSADRRVEPSVRARPIADRAARDRPDRASGDFLSVRGARANNLKGIDVDFPRGLFTCVTGAAGSGKSSLVHECLMASYPDAIMIDQSPIGRTSRGNLATYTGTFDAIRKIFSASTGRDASLFSFNSLGACPKCGGQGVVGTELFFLDAFRTACDECGGKRYGKEVLGLAHNGKNIDDVLSMTATEALAFFDHPKIRARMGILVEVGLDYVKLGQSLSSLSGGESQRLKIAAELSKKGNAYVLDEPTTGLHLSDIERLYGIIRRLTDAGNTVIVIEHNPDLIKYADWIIDLGPEGGNAGGELVYQGLPEGFAACGRSLTAPYVTELWK